MLAGSDEVDHLQLGLLRGWTAGWSTMAGWTEKRLLMEVLLLRIVSILLLLLVQQLGVRPRTTRWRLVIVLLLVRCSSWREGAPLIVSVVEMVVVVTIVVVIVDILPALVGKCSKACIMTFLLFEEVVNGQDRLFG